MQRSSSIKSVSSPKNDFTVQKAIKRILFESAIEGNEDDQSSNQRNLPNYGDWYRNRSQLSSHRISRRETPKEATEEDDNQREFSYIFTTNLEQFDDKDYPYLSKKIHEVNKSFQKSKQGNGNTNENEKIINQKTIMNKKKETNKFKKTKILILLIVLSLFKMYQHNHIQIKEKMHC